MKYSLKRIFQSHFWVTVIFCILDYFDDGMSDYVRLDMCRRTFTLLKMFDSFVDHSLKVFLDFAFEIFHSVFADFVERPAKVVQDFARHNAGDVPLDVHVKGREERGEAHFQRVDQVLLLVPDVRVVCRKLITKTGNDEFGRQKSFVQNFSTNLVETFRHDSNLRDLLEREKSEDSFENGFRKSKNRKVNFLLRREILLQTNSFHFVLKSENKKQIIY